MKWELTLYTPKGEKRRVVFESENAEEARMKAAEELKNKKAAVFELSKLE